MEEPLQAHAPGEMRFYLMVTSCAACGQGPLAPEEQDLPAADTEADRQATVQARCHHCGAEQAFAFRWEHVVAPDADATDRVNPGAAPSRIIDLGQWVGLYYQLADAAEANDSPSEHRRIANQAYVCLAEALKFYGDGEMPPETAFFSEATAEAYHQHPETYARTRLRELQARLPVPVHHAQAPPETPEPAAARPWWRFWAK